MMMQAIRAGGIPIVFSPDEDEVARMNETEDYHPAKEGLFELPLGLVVQPNFPEPEIYDDKCIKLFPPPWMTLSAIRPGDYKVVWLHRDVVARSKSFRQFHAKFPLFEHDRLVLGHHVVLQRLRDIAADAALHVCHHRIDMDVIELEFDEVIDKPGTAFGKLADAGWPIDPIKAATVPDPARRRFETTG